MITHTDAVESPRMRPRSARSLMLSCGTDAGASVPPAVVGVGEIRVVSRAAASEWVQATTHRTAVRVRRRVCDMGRLGSVFRGEALRSVVKYRPDATR